LCIAVDYKNRFDGIGHNSISSWSLPPITTVED
jgi:hypothetical protein